jgi:hypothetical protein
MKVAALVSLDPTPAGEVAQDGDRAREISISDKIVAVLQPRNACQLGGAADICTTMKRKSFEPRHLRRGR